MHGLGMRGDVTSDIRPMIKQFYTPAPYSKLVQDGEVLVVGVGGIGCLWAVEAHSGCPNLAELLLIDADESSFEGASDANCLFLDSGGEGRGAAALPSMAIHRLRDGIETLWKVISHWV